MNKKFFKGIILEEVHPVLLQIFQENNIHVINAAGMSNEDIQHTLRDIDILIVRSKVVNKEIIDLSPRLKIIGRAGSGLENIDREYAANKNILCINSPEGNRDAVAEHLIGMLLMLLNKLHHAHEQVRNNIWNRKDNWGVEMKKQTFAIIGYGNVGSAVAKKLSGFECKIIAHDKYKTITDNYVEQVELKDIYEQADIVSLHIPLTQETYYYADEKFFNSFKKNIYFINTSRGRCVKTSALVNTLKANKVKGACLDVLEYEDTNFEKLNELQIEDFEYLKKSDKVILTPHIAGWTYQSYEKICKILAEKIVKIIHNYK